ncbi:maleylpyruvate isomerase N-terminal domain-containing protein [Micromonospora arborensis]|uniref:maleylpyruvate isomerase N-terminal domain-containing protein n=1 Tax=Micromonospora arborensis TaxID=2116518 RepID=UPI003421FB69
MACYRRVYHEGVAAVRAIVAGYGPEDWSRTGPCHPWSGSDLLRHLQITAGQSLATLAHAWRHGPEELMTPDELALFNDRTLISLAPAEPTATLAEFVRLAGRYLVLASASPDLPCYSYRGRVWDVACSVGVLAVEWHMHAWDLAVTIGVEHRPREPALLVEAFRTGMAYLPAPPTEDWAGLVSAAGRQLRVDQAA